MSDYEPGQAADDVAERCGYVAVLGRPNAGKSTLVNTLVGAKITIVTNKVQTTRNRVLGITIHDGAQLILVDTPGIFAPKRRLERAMVAAAWGGAADADLCCVVVDVSRRDPLADAAPVLDGLRESGRPGWLVLNKVDLIKRERLLAITGEADATGLFSSVFMISALSGDGVADLKDALAAALPAGPWLFEPDQMSDMPMRLLAAELTREKLFQDLHAELPYRLTVKTESWEEFQNSDVRVRQLILVERNSQKAIVLGKDGHQIKRVRQNVQTELKEILEQQVHLFLQVKVCEKWAERREHYQLWGLDYG
jgi:GTP-binding protein Era